MPTSKLDRLNKLFEGEKRFAQADPDKPHIIDLDVIAKSSEVEQAVSRTVPAKKPRKIPEVTQTSSKITPSSPPSRQDTALPTSSNADEYVGSFSGKSTLNKPSISSLPAGQSSKGEYHQKVMVGAHLNRPASGLVDHDVDGNPLTGHFCPLTLVAKLPYKYMTDTNGRVSKHFFAENKFYLREWDVYYVAPLGSVTAKPILLLPLAQVKHLIQEINLVFKTEIGCPPDPFTVSFFDDGTPQPKHLGISRCRDDVAAMQASIPPWPGNSTECLENWPQDAARHISALELSGSDVGSWRSMTDAGRKPTERSLADFKAKIERILASAKRGKQAAKQKKTADRLLQQQDWVKQLKLAQCYFGLRPRAMERPAPYAASSPSQQQGQREKDLPASSMLLDPLDTSKPVPYAFESNPVIVCVDVEAYERDHGRITEIGVSTLDTLDLAGLAPGKGGENWIAHIRSRHFRIRGREHLENRDFCPGNANNFRFGTSEWVAVNMAATAIDQCFEYPFSAQFKHQKRNGADSADSGLSSGLSEAQKGPKKRNVIFLGHDIRNEFEYLRILGSRISCPADSTSPSLARTAKDHRTDREETGTNIIEALDTGVLYRVLAKETQNQSLGKILLGLDRPAFHLHNAGNDARYTLEALVALLIKSRVLEDEATLNENTPPTRTWRDLQSTVGMRKDRVKERDEEKSCATDRNGRVEYTKWERALHTMNVVNQSVKYMELDDAWLMAQQSDELPRSPARKEERHNQWIEDTDGTRSIVYRDPAATGGGQDRVVGSTNSLSGNEAAEGGLAKVASEGN